MIVSRLNTYVANKLQPTDCISNLVCSKPMPDGRNVLPKKLVVNSVYPPVHHVFDGRYLQVMFSNNETKNPDPRCALEKNARIHCIYQCGCLK